MKKILAIFLLISMMAGLAACGGKEEPVQPVTPAEPPVAGPVQEPDPEPEHEPKPDFYGTAFSNSAEALAFLDGDWTLCMMGRLPVEGEPSTALKIDSMNKKAELVRDDGATVKMTIEAGSLFEEDEYISQLTVVPYEASDGFTGWDDITWKNLEDYFQFLVCNIGDMDYLMLREPGNGMTVLADEGFGFNLMAGDYAWVLTRPAKEVPAGMEENAAWREKESVFYAYRWFSSEDYVVLQALNGDEHTEDWYGDPFSAVRIDCADNGHALRGVCYDLYERADRETYELGTAVSPGLVRVETDEEGVVTDIEELEYVGYAVYLTGTPLTGRQTVHADWEHGQFGDTDRFDVFTATEAEHSTRVVMWTDKTVRNLTVYSLFLKEMSQEGVPDWEMTEVYRQDVLTPEKNLLLVLPYFEDLPTFGFSYEDTDGSVRYFDLGMSGRDGSLLVHPWD